MKKIFTPILILLSIFLFNNRLKAQVKSGFTTRNDTICSSSGLAIFTNTSSGGTKPYKFLWDFGDGDTSTLSNPYHIYSSGGVYKVTLYVLDAGFDTNSTHKYITALASPKPDLGTDKRGCWGHGILLTTGLAHMASANWTWINGKDTVSNKFKGDTIVVNDSGNYSVIVYDSMGCKGTSSVNVFFNPLVQVRNLDTTVCYGDSVYLKAGTPANGASYTWIDVIHNNTVGTDPILKIHLVTAAGYGVKAYFKVVIRQSQHGVTCVDTGYINVSVNTPTHPILNPLPPKCINDPAFHLPDGDAGHRGGTWYCPGNPGAIVGNYLYPSIMGETDTNHALGFIHYLYANEYKCATDDSTRINIYALPKVFAGNDTVICTKNGKYLLSNAFVSPPGGIWVPVTGTPSSAIVYSTNHDSVYFDPNSISDGTYGVEYSYMEPGSARCSNSDTVFIRVSVKCNLGLNQNLNPDLNLSVFPNPFSAFANIKYTLDRPSKVMAGIFDVTGKQIMQILNENQEAGNHNVSIDAEKLELKQGIYLLKFTTDEGSVSRQIIKF